MDNLNWKVSHEDPSIIYSNSELIAIMQGDSNDDDVILQACLISAAPDMFEILKKWPNIQKEEVDEAIKKASGKLFFKPKFVRKRINNE